MKGSLAKQVAARLLEACSHCSAFCEDEGVRRPEWIKEAPELVESLLKIREAGVWELRRTRIAIKPLEDIAKTLCPPQYHEDQHRLVEHTLQLAISRLRSVEYKEAASILFDITEGAEPHRSSATERREQAALRLNQGLSTFRKAEGGYERPLLMAVAQAIQDLAAEHNMPVIEDPLVRLDYLAVLPEDVIISRSLLHVARTLAQRRLHAKEEARAEIDELLTRYANWNAGRDESGATMLISFDALSRKYLKLSVFDLMGSLESTSPGPSHPPHLPFPGMRYPEGESFTPISGGTDPFTGEVVQPYYMAHLPVSMMEWVEFLTKFEWPGIGHWAELSKIPGNFNLASGGKLPAVCMTYLDCVGYCFWLWLTTPYRFRLPTEAEWNYAATGGKRRDFPWGSNVDYSRANISSSGKVNVDAARPSGPFNMVGLSGNIWEFTSSLWDGEEPMPASEIVLPDIMIPLITYEWWQADERLSVNRGNYLDTRVVMKGGSWSLGPEYAKVGSRIFSSFFNSGEYGGFRLAVSAVKDPATGRYVPEPSPFVHRELRQVRSMSVEDMASLLQQFHIAEAQRLAVDTGCPTGSTITSTPGKPTSWEEIVRGTFSA